MGTEDGCSIMEREHENEMEHTSMHGDSNEYVDSISWAVCRQDDASICKCVVESDCPNWFDNMYMTSAVYQEMSRIAHLDTESCIREVCRGHHMYSQTRDCFGIQHGAHDLGMQACAGAYPRDHMLTILCTGGMTL